MKRLRLRFILALVTLFLASCGGGGSSSTPTSNSTGVTTVLAQTTVPHTFVAGTATKTSDLNDNFKALAAEIDNLKARVAKPTLGVPVTEQLAFTLLAACFGFVAAVFFCVGNAMNSSDKILLQATPFWDFSEPVARALASQRAQYAVGALLLVVSFLLQVAAALASSSTPANLPQWLHTWPYLVLAVLAPTALIAGGCSALLYKTTMRQVLRKEKERREKDAKKAPPS